MSDPTPSASDSKSSSADPFSHVHTNEASSSSTGSSAGSSSQDIGDEDHSNQGLIIGVACAALVILALVVGFWLLKRKRRDLNKKQTGSGSHAVSQRGSLTVRDIDDLAKSEKASSWDGESELMPHYHNQDMRYADGSQAAATFAPSSYAGAALPPRPPPNAAQDQAHIHNMTRSNATSRPPQGEL